MLVAHPNGRQYGHLGLEMVMSLAHARKDGADVYFVSPSTSLGSGFFELESTEVRVLRPTPVIGELLRTGVSCRKFLDRVDRWLGTLRQQLEREFAREVAPYVADLNLPESIRQRLRSVRRRLRASLEQETHDKRKAPPVLQTQPASGSGARAVEARG